MCVGIPDSNDASLLLAFQAADIRADSYGFCRTQDRPFTSWGEMKLAASYGNVNFIVWKSIKL